MKRTYCDLCKTELTEREELRGGIKSEATRPRVEVRAWLTESEGHVTPDLCHRCIAEAVIEAYNATAGLGRRIEVTLNDAEALVASTKPRLVARRSGS